MKIPVQITTRPNNLRLRNRPSGHKNSNCIIIPRAPLDELDAVASINHIGKSINSREKPNDANVMNRGTQEMLSDAQRSKLKIAHLNIRSLKNRNHLIRIRERLRDTNYDILAMSELKLC